jgi:prepilin-type N-terminal cleavage/methylation domain-containing protein
MPPAGRRQAHATDDGFTLIELVVALSIVFAVVASMIFLFVGSLKTVTQAKQRQTATALATQTLERLRALPYDVIKTGVNKSTASFAADPNIADKATTPRLFPGMGSINEILVVSSAQATAPLSDHRTVNVVEGVSYTVGVYVTQAATTQPSFNLTALVTYSSAVSQGTKTILQRTTAFSPSGCLSTSTHPFAGPCQASFSARAGVTSAGITLANPLDPTAGMFGLGATSAGLELAELATSADIEQTTTITAGAKTTTATKTDSGVTSTSGGKSALTAADSDPSSSAAAATDSKTAPAQTSGVQSVSGSGGLLTVTPTTGDTGNADSQVVAGAAGCVATTGVAVASGQPCASGAVQPQGTTGQIQLDIFGDNGAAGRDLPAFTLASVAAAPSATRAMAGRFTTTNAAACTAAAPPNCAHASVTRSVGTTTVGAVPPRSGGLDTGPAAYTGSFSVTGLAESARAESGTGYRAATLTRTAGTLSYWNGVGYTSVTMSGVAADATYDPPAATFTYRQFSHIGVVMTVDSIIRVSAPRLTSVPATPGACTPDACTQRATSGSTVSADTTYVISIDGSETVRFVIRTDLGALNAQTSFRAAPLA